jgi:hydrogenase maturation protease
MKILVLGLGNELYGDDATGIHVVRNLREELLTEKGRQRMRGVDLEECSLSGFALLDVVVGYDTLIIVDTIKKSKPVTGKVHILEEKDLRHIPGPSPHYVSIPQTLDIGKKMKLKVPARIRIIAVEAKNLYNLGEGLSEEMRIAIPVIAEKVKKILKEERSRR